MFNVYVTYLYPVLAVMIFIGFIIYETDEGWKIKDESYIDIKNFLLGMIVGAIILSAYFLSPFGG